MEFSEGKYKIVTGIFDYKINPKNPKYFAKFLNDDVEVLGHTEDEAIEGLKKLYKEYKAKNKLFPSHSDQVLNPYVPTEKFQEYFDKGISIAFFELIEEDSYTQIDDEFTVQDLELSNKQIEIINDKYQLSVRPEDVVVDIFDRIKNS